MAQNSCSQSTALSKFAPLVSQKELVHSGLLQPLSVRESWIVDRACYQGVAQNQETPTFAGWRLCGFCWVVCMQRLLAPVRFWSSFVLSGGPLGSCLRSRISVLCLSSLCLISKHRYFKLCCIHVVFSWLWSSIQSKRFNRLFVPAVR